MAEPAGVRRQPGREGGEGGGSGRRLYNRRCWPIGKPWTASRHGRRLRRTYNYPSPSASGRRSCRRRRGDSWRRRRGRRELWRRFPDDALLACAGRIDAGALMELIQDLPAEGRQEHCRSECGVWQGIDQERIVPRRPGLGILSYRPADRTVRNGCRKPSWPFAPSRATKSHRSIRRCCRPSTPPRLRRPGVQSPARRRAAHLKSMESNKQTIHYVEYGRVLPPGMQPAYGLMGGWMALASSPDVFRRFTEAASKPAVEDGAPFPLCERR